MDGFVTLLNGSIVGQRGATVKEDRMRARSFAATMAGMAALLVARPSAASQEGAFSTEGALLGDDLRAVKRDVLLLVSAGLSRLGMWTQAAAVSRHLVARADDAFDACVAQAAVTWQTAEASLDQRAFTEWEKLRRLATDIELDTGASLTNKEVCRVAYRRVTGHLIYREHSTTHCGRPSLQTLWMERLRFLFAAYEAAVQQGAAADGASRRR